jgi:DUF4097 and DUF4098 domain-containing protein YvlB
MNTSITKTAMLFVFVTAALVANAQEINKTFSGIKKIKLNTSSGDIILAKGNSSDVQVKVTFTYDNSDYAPVFEQNGTALTLKEEFNKQSVSGRAKWTLTIPDGIELRASSGSGNMDASDLKMTISANTGSGNYNWKNISGESDINTGSGDIELTSYQGNIDLNTGSGDIVVNQTNGDITANTGSGNILMSSVKGGISANTGSGNIKAQELNLTSKGLFNTGSGKVVVVLTAPLTKSLSLSSGSGDAVLDCKGSKLEGKLIMTASKRHGEIKAPYTFDKTEEINDSGDDNTRIRKTVQLGSSDIEIKISTGSGTAEVKK